jgi:UDP-N-acetyl-D-glucosamine dehydrogenase
VAWNRETIAGLDVTLIPTAHPAVNCQELADWSPGIVDPRNALAGVKVDAEKVWKACGNSRFTIYDGRDLRGSARKS